MRPSCSSQPSSSTGSGRSSARSSAIASATIASMLSLRCVLPPRAGDAARLNQALRNYMRPALKAVGITKPFRPGTTSATPRSRTRRPRAILMLTSRPRRATARARSRHRDIHAAQVLFLGAAEKAEERMFGVAG